MVVISERPKHAWTSVVEQIIVDTTLIESPAPPRVRQTSDRLSGQVPGRTLSMTVITQPSGSKTAESVPAEPATAASVTAGSVTAESVTAESVTAESAPTESAAELLNSMAAMPAGHPSRASL